MSNHNYVDDSQIVIIYGTLQHSQKISTHRTSVLIKTAKQIRSLSVIN